MRYNLLEEEFYKQIISEDRVMVILPQARNELFVLSEDRVMVSLPNHELQQKIVVPELDEGILVQPLQTHRC